MGLGKRGSIIDLIYIGVIFTVFAVAILIAFTISSNLNDRIQSNTDLEAKGKAAYAQVNDLYTGVIDNSFLLLAIGLAIVSIILASMVRIHPVFFAFYTVLLVIIIFMSGVFSNIYLEMANTPSLEPYAEQLTFTTRVMYILPWFVGVVGILLSIIMYKNYKEATG